jgi:GNAT superfamily N-acetyltransferase
MATTIRTATADDAPQILAFIRALAEYERAPEGAVTATEEGLRRDGFGPLPFFECLLADYDGQPAGFALFFFNYSTWRGQAGVYLEDLFVLPELRGKGIGKALLQRVAAESVARGCGRLQWQVLDWNTPAIDFYVAMGGEFMDEWRTVRLDDAALIEVARGTVARGTNEIAVPPFRQKTDERMGQRADEMRVSAGGQKTGGEKAKESVGQPEAEAAP